MWAALSGRKNSFQPNRRFVAFESFVSTSLVFHPSSDSTVCGPAKIKLIPFIGRKVCDELWLAYVLQFLGGSYPENLSRVPPYRARNPNLKNLLLIAMNESIRGDFIAKMTWGSLTDIDWNIFRQGIVSNIVKIMISHKYRVNRDIKSFSMRGSWERLEQEVTWSHV